MPRMHRDRVRPEGKRSFQRAAQLLSAALLNGYAIGFGKGRIFTGKTKALCVPVLNCYSCPGALGACPVGSLQTALGGGGFPFYVLGLLMLFGAVLGRTVCGLLCPFGLVQDLLHKIPAKKWKVPKKLDKPARFLKYAILLAMVVLLPLLSAVEAGVALPWFCKYLCPAGTLGGGIPLLLSNPSLRRAAGLLFSWKVLVLAVVAVLSVAVHRPFCKYLCPLGAFYSVFNRFSFYQMYLDRKKCVDCGKCEQSCPMGVKVRKDCNGSECIRCGQCKAACTAGAISFGFSRGKAEAEKGRQPG